VTIERENQPRAALNLRPIGLIRTPFPRPEGTPIQPTEAAGAQGRVEVYREYENALQDLEGFERIWLLYWMDRAPEPRLRVRPFLDTAERGLFATRAPCRPNPIGMSCVRLLEVRGNILVVEDVDMLDQTPLLDIKPYAARFDSFSVSRGGWLDNAPVCDGIADGRFSTEADASMEHKE
jgi:tRNA-Thr(GGU) m(6)t(6)A37 methyltransferase TsaA